MKTLLLLFLVVILLFSVSFCQNNTASKLYLDFKTEDLKSNAVNNYSDKMNYITCFQFVKNKNNFILYNINDENELLKFDLIQDTLTKFKLPIPKSSESTTFKVLNNKLICLYDKIFYSYDLQNYHLDTLNFRLDKDAYLVTNLNHNCCNFINDSTFYLQIGKDNTYNFIDTSLFTFFNLGGSSYNLYKYPKEFHSRYIHYLNYVTANDKDTIYAINAMDNKLLKYSPNGKKDSIFIDAQKIPVFDTTHMTDLLYVKKYSENEVNTRLFLFPKYIVLVRQDYTSKKAIGFLSYMYVFDRKLLLLSKSKIKHPVGDPRFILSEENHLMFLDFDNKKLYQYDFN